MSGVIRDPGQCPFPGACERWSDSGCTVEKQSPLIFCSLAERARRPVEFTKTSIGSYLDRHIAVWAEKARFTRSEFAGFYVDAYQKLRKDLLGTELRLPVRASRTRNEEIDPLESEKTQNDWNHFVRRISFGGIYGK